MLSRTTWKMSEPPRLTGDPARDVEILYDALARVKTDVLDILKSMNEKGVLSITQASINESTIGSVLPGTGAFTTISASGQITSTVASGTAPFIIASTTVVTNLNADMVDGRHADISVTGFTCAVRDVIGDLYTNAFQAANGTAGAPTFTFSSDPNTGIYRVGADALGISAGGTKRVEVNTTQLNASVNVLGVDFVASRGDGTGVIYLNSALTRYLYYDGTQFQFFGAPSAMADGSASNPGITFYSDLNTGIYRAAADKMALVTGGIARFWVNASGFIGAGIDPASRNNCVLELSSGLGFPATQLASTDVNVLDDYEEGTFTPTITSAIGSFTSITSTVGEYTKIGNRVLWYIEFTITTNGTADGYITASGFPFTFGQNHEGNGREAAALGWQLQAEGGASGSSVIIVKWDNSFPTDRLNGRLIRCNGQYRV